MVGKAWAVAALCLGLWSVQAQGACRQALALALDVSGSVDAREYRLQLDGVAQALSAPNVRQALLEQPGGHVRLMVFEWSGPGDHRVLTPWTTIQSETALLGVIAQLQGVERRNASPGTALGDAMQLGAEFLRAQSGCRAHTLDISGDGKSNLGQRPRDVKPRVAFEGLTINGLVIGADAPSIGDVRQTEIAELSAYFRAEVILGDDAFVETALGFEDYADAMTRKLERELQVMVLSQHMLPEH